MSQKFRTLFHKLRRLRLLYRPARPLCKHEVAALQASALSFGHWFPMNFPDSSITPKLHWLITHITDTARRFWSSGQTTEQVIESFHANLNSYGRSYACIQNTQRRFAAMTKNHWARIWQGSVRDYHSGKRRVRKPLSSELTTSKAIRDLRAIRKERRVFSLSRKNIWNKKRFLRLITKIKKER